jgi:hypothetical protein
MDLYLLGKIILFILSIYKGITTKKICFLQRKKIFMNSNINKINKNSQCIISLENGNNYCNNNSNKFFKEKIFLQDKKLITISPGGFKGFYLLGILTYIKEKYNLDKFIYSGASAGSWNSLFMCYKGNTLDFVYNLLDSNIKKAKSITELEFILKYKLLSTYKDDDFDFRRLFIGVTTFRNFLPSTNIFADFASLEDAINCCMASSHIPFVTGGLTNKYHNMFTFDGGFCSYPYLINDNLILHITPGMWSDLENNNNINIMKKNIEKFKKYSEFFSLSKNNLLELFDDGYQDAKNHKEYFDKLFAENTNTNTNDNVNYDDSIIEF